MSFDIISNDLTKEERNHLRRYERLFFDENGRPTDLEEVPWTEVERFRRELPEKILILENREWYAILGAIRLFTEAQNHVWLTHLSVDRVIPEPISDTLKANATLVEFLKTHPELLLNNHVRLSPEIVDQTKLNLLVLLVGFSRMAESFCEDLNEAIIPLLSFDNRLVERALENTDIKLRGDFEPDELYHTLYRFTLFATRYGDKGLIVG